MPLRCPICYQPLNTFQYNCPEGHTYALEDGVLVLLGGETGDKIRHFNREYFNYRQGKQDLIQDSEDFAALPYVQTEQGNDAWQLEWRLRTYDWELIRKMLRGRQNLSSLDIGAWNGWLSNRLAAMGHKVTAIDFFNDTYDGLAAKKHYPANWKTIQMDLDDLSVLDFQYDLIIINRCLQYFADPVSYVRAAQAILSPTGLMILTGLQFLRDPTARKKGIEELEAELGLAELSFFKPIRGYLDHADRARLRAFGVKIYPYRQLFLANLKSNLIKKAPWHGYGLVATGTSTPGAS